MLDKYLRKKCKAKVIQLCTLFSSCLFLHLEFQLQTTQHHLSISVPTFPTPFPTPASAAFSTRLPEASPGLGRGPRALQAHPHTSHPIRRSSKDGQSQQVLTSQLSPGRRRGTHETRKTVKSFTKEQFDPEPVFHLIRAETCQHVRQKTNLPLRAVRSTGSGLSHPVTVQVRSQPETGYHGEKQPPTPSIRSLSAGIFCFTWHTGHVL